MVARFAFACILMPVLWTGAYAGSGSGQDPGETIEIIAAHLEGRLDADPDSGYNKLLAKVLPTQSHYLKYQRYPLARALRKFAEAKRVCLFPASLSSVNLVTNIPTDDMTESTPIDIVSAHFISAPGRKTYDTIESLSGATISVQQGVAEKALSSLTLGLKKIKTPDDLSALKMLLAGRVDVMYGWYPDSHYIAEKNNLPLPHFDPSLIFFQTTTHFVCKNFGGVEELMKILNTRLDKLRHSGELGEILGKHARIVK